jgi:hypothetical protein
MAYGLVFDKNDVKQQLRKYNRTYDGRRFWSGLYGSVGQQLHQGSNDIESAYSNAILEAYKSKYGSDQFVAGSSLGDARKQQLFEANEALLQEAYSANQANRLAQYSALQMDAQKQIQSYDELLNQQAQNVSDYAQSHFDYLQYLYDDAIENGDLESSIFMTDPQWSKYLTIDPETQEYTLVDMNDLKSTFFDESGELNVRGIDFFDQMENQMSGEGGQRAKSFDEYLYENNSELFDWKNQYNPYNYTEEGSNAGSFREMVSRASTDATYTFMERAGGMSREQAHAVIDSYDEKFNNLINDLYSGAKPQKTIDDLKAQFDELRTLAESLGVTDAIDAKWGGFDNIQAKLNAYDENVKTGWQLSGDFFTDVIKSIGVTATSGAAVGSVVPGVGTLTGLGVGAIIGTVGGMISGGVNTATRKDANLRQAKEAASYFSALRQEIFNEAFKNAYQN